VAVALFVVSAYLPKDLTGAADPLNKEHYTPEPAWYFFGIYQLLKYFHGPMDAVGMVGLPAVGILVLLFLPWIDRNPSRKVRKRPIALGTAAVVMIGLSFLTYQGMNSVPKAMAATGVIAHPTYQKDILPVVKNYCSQCHTEFTTYSGISKVVTPGNPDKSLLYGHITGKIQPQMPFGQKPLSKDMIQTFKNWIQDGAKN
jgi:ubiquinol-cytochrome c reductase cytochrome b subunit